MFTRATNPIKEYELVRQKSSQQGFTVFEILITLFLVAMMLVLYEAALNTIALARNARDQQIALRAANHELEALRGGGYDALPASGAFSDPQVNRLPQGSGSITIADHSDKTKAVSVTVVWHEPGSGSDHNVTLETLITQVGGLK